MTSSVATAIVTLSERPDLAEITGAWCWDAFFRHDGIDRTETIAREQEASAGTGLFPTVLILLEGELPIGMVALCLDDLEGRPDLNPWLAGLYVDPGHRRRGHALLLIDKLETLARSEGIERLSLYTESAADLYAKVGWATFETFETDGMSFSIMQKPL